MLQAAGFIPVADGLRSSLTLVLNDDDMAALRAGDGLTVDCASLDGALLPDLDVQVLYAPTHDDALTRIGWDGVVREPPV